MEESEFTSNANMFENMDIAQKGFARESEIHLYQYESKLGQRHPYVFCQICGKYGRKDWLKIRHFKQHPYSQKSKQGFVNHGQEPSWDKYGDFERFQAHFGIQRCSQEETSLKNESEDEDFQECHRQPLISGNQPRRFINEQDTFQDLQEDISDAHRYEISELNLSSKESIQSEESRPPKHSKQKKDQKLKKQANQKSPQTSRKKCGNQEKDMMKQKGSKQKRKSSKQKKKDMKITKKILKKSMKKLQFKADSTVRKCARELRNLVISDEIKKSANRFMNKWHSQVPNTCQIHEAVKDDDPAQRPNTSPPKKDTSDKLQILLLKLEARKHRKDCFELLQHFKEKNQDLIAQQDKELYKTWDDHKHLMLKEREAHVSLYHEKANFESTKMKLHNQMICTRDQRQEINILLTRLAKYAKRELSDYPQNLLQDGQYDPQIWKLTRKAETDEDLIKDQALKLKEIQEELETERRQNQDFASQILSAKEQIKMLTDATKVAIQNIQSQQSSSFGNQFQQFQRQNNSANFGNPQDSPIPKRAGKTQMNLAARSEQQNIEYQRIRALYAKQPKRVRFNDDDEIIGCKLVDSNNPINTREYNKRSAIRTIYKKKTYLLELFSKREKKQITFTRQRSQRSNQNAKSANK